MKIEYQCPECGDKEILVYSATSYRMNTGEFFCHSVKTHDLDAEVSCLECGYRGNRAEVLDKNPTFAINSGSDIKKAKKGDYLTLSNGNFFTINSVHETKIKGEFMLDIISDSGHMVEMTIETLKGAIITRVEDNHEK